MSALGQLVGINSQIVSPSGGNIGIGFAIPARMAETVMTQLVNGGEVHRGQLGVTVQGMTSELAQGLGLDEVKGALVSGVVKGSPAAKAGIERGDVIVSLDGKSVTDSNALRNSIASTKPGSSVSLGIVRDGREKKVQRRPRRAPVRPREGRPRRAAERRPPRSGRAAGHARGGEGAGSRVEAGVARGRGGPRGPRRGGGNPPRAT